MAFELASYLKQVRTRVDEALKDRLPPRDDDDGDDALRLREAIQRSVLGGGKRLRPCVVVAGCEAVGGELDDALGAACALEMIHSYSLVHDDLPAMDDDDLRRGEPSCHRAFGEAAAILTGDALLTLAFETLGKEATGHRLGAAVIARAVVELGRAAGTEGMVGGQAMDLSFKDKGRSELPSFEQLERCHRGKTGALFSASAAIGAMVGGGSDAQVELLRGYGADIGLAFQHADDLRDEEFVHWRDQALQRAVELSRRAASVARQLGHPPLVALAELIESRARDAIKSSYSGGK